MNTLSSNQLKQVTKLQQKKFREEEKKFFVEGFRGVEEAINSDWEIEMLITTAKSYSSDMGGKVFSAATKKRILPFEISEKEFAKLSDTENAQGILAIVHQKNFQLNAQNSLLYALRSTLIAFDSVNDPGNLGTMLRTCDWFGVDGILLGKNCVELFNPKVVRASMGAIFHLPIFVEQDLGKEIPTLKENGFHVATATVHAKNHCLKFPFLKNLSSFSETKRTEFLLHWKNFPIYNFPFRNLENRNRSMLRRRAHRY